MKRKVLYGLAALGVALGGLGFLVAASGLVPVKASSGHWAVTRWFLSFSMARSVDTHSTGTPVPDLSDPSLVMRGAGHYETGCQPCHGAPGDLQSGVALRMTPHPPYLPEEVHHWEPAELYYLVRHGVKMTGMPAWPAQERGDEVWAVVAFLLELPEMDPDEYRWLARGEEPAGRGGGSLAAAPEDAPPAGGGGDGARDDLASLGQPPAAALESCARCHGRDGRGRGTAAFPALAGQTPEYLEASLRAYALGDRKSGIMQPLAEELDEAAARELALWYGARGGAGPTVDAAVPAPGGVPAPRAGVRAGEPASGPSPEPLRDGGGGSPERGREIARRGVPERKVPACVACHGPSDQARNPRFPDLAGQYAGYLALQLRLFREGRRGGTEYGHVMEQVVRGMTGEDMADVAAYYASLSGPGSPGPPSDAGAPPPEGDRGRAAPAPGPGAGGGAPPGG